MPPIKLIVFDFDGCLIDLRETHFTVLNQALSEVNPQYAITPNEQTTTFEGLSTKRKLALLSDLKGLPADTHARIFDRKQALTIEAIKQTIQRDDKLISLLTILRAQGYKTAIASNAIFDTVYAGLMALGVWKLFDRIYSNEDIDPARQKPCPDIYLRAMLDFGVDPSQTLIVEDSKVGREAAYRSGAFVCGVDNPNDLTLQRIERAIQQAKPKPKRWAGGGVNIVVAASGAGSRFAKAGYKLPKPLIDVQGKPMIQRVVENLNIDARFIFVVQKTHYDGYYLGTLLNSIAPRCEVICVDKLTEGAACSVLLAREFIDNDDHLIIANSDQVIDWDAEGFMWQLVSQEVDGQMLTFNGDNPQWSYAREENGWVVEVAEKRVISNHATSGIYAWRRGKDFVRYADQMIAKDIRTNGEFYVCPVYQEAINDGKKIKIFECAGMFGMGTPSELEATLASGALGRI